MAAASQNDQKLSSKGSGNKTWINISSLKLGLGSVR